ncbi:uclacyanin-3 [Fagus crenata]
MEHSTLLVVALVGVKQVITAPGLLVKHLRLVTPFVMFTYTTTHKVDIVNQADYNNCNSGNAIQSYQDGNTTIPLSSAGTTYYICPTAGHCSGGMKLSVNVVAASTAPSGTPPTTPSTTVSPPPPPPPPHSGAASISCNMNNLMFGFLLVLVTMFAYMG